MATTTKKEKEVLEVEIFTQEQLDSLTPDIKKTVIHLQSNLPSNELLVLNPLVSDLLKLKELEALVYIPLDETLTDKAEIKAEKERFKLMIGEFSAAKSTISEFKKKTAAAKKAIKGPLDELGKEVITLERGLNAIAETTLGIVESIFESYITAQKQKAEETKKAKEEKETAAVNALTEENKAQSNLVLKGQVTTFLKFEMLEPTKEKSQEAIANYSLENLFKFRDELALLTFESLSAGKDLTLLDEEELTQIKEKFKKDIDVIKENINVKITALEATENNKALENKIDAITEIGNIAPAQQISMPSFSSYASSGDSFTGTNPQTSTQSISLSQRVNEKGLIPTVEEIILKAKHEIKLAEEAFRTINTLAEDKTTAEYDQARRVRGSMQLLDKTILYIKNQLEPKQ